MFPKARPTLWKQLFIMTVRMGTKATGYICLPIAFGWLPDKSERSYQVFALLLRDACERRNILIKTKKIRMDFELNIHKAFINCWAEGTETSGCVFHFDQCITRKVQNQGLITLYNTNANFRKFVRKILALPQVRLKDIEDAVNVKIANFEFENDADGKKERFKVYMVKYINSYWINGPFPPKTWNAFNKRSDSTNNTSEAYNSRLNGLLTSIHPSPWSLLLLIIKELNRSVTRVKSFRHGIKPEQPRKLFKILLDKRNHMKDLLIAGLITLDDYMDNVGNTVMKIKKANRRGEFKEKKDEFNENHSDEDESFQNEAKISSKRIITKISGLKSGNTTVSNILVNEPSKIITKISGLKSGKVVASCSLLNQDSIFGNLSSEDTECDSRLESQVEPTDIEYDPSEDPYKSRELGRRTNLNFLFNKNKNSKPITFKKECTNCRIGFNKNSKFVQCKGCDKLTHNRCISKSLTKKDYYCPSCYKEPEVPVHELSDTFENMPESNKVNDKSLEICEESKEINEQSESTFDDPEKTELSTNKISETSSLLVETNLVNNFQYENYIYENGFSQSDYADSVIHSPKRNLLRKDYCLEDYEQKSVNEDALKENEIGLRKNTLKVFEEEFLHKAVNSMNLCPLDEVDDDADKFYNMPSGLNVSNMMEYTTRRNFDPEDLICPSLTKLNNTAPENTISDDWKHSPIKKIETSTPIFRETESACGSNSPILRKTQSTHENKSFELSKGKSDANTFNFNDVTEHIVSSNNTERSFVNHLVTLDPLAKHIKDKNLPLVFRKQTRSDGNCWYDATADQVKLHNVKNVPQDHKKLREAVCDAMLTMPQKQQWISSLFGGKESKYLSFVKKHRKLGEWTDKRGIMCQATALFVGRNINVVGTANKDSESGFTSLDSTDVMRNYPAFNIGYYQDLHFQSLSMKSKEKKEANNEEKQFEKKNIDYESKEKKLIKEKKSEKRTIAYHKEDQCDRNENKKLKSEDIKKKLEDIKEKRTTEYDCNEKKTFAKRKNSEEDNIPRKKPRIQCDKCSYTSADRSNMKKHIKGIHEGIKFNCSFKNCSYKASCHSNLTKHIKSMHM